MEIRFHNTLSGKKEIFKPIKDGEVKMYNCGPTVYDYVHIGNLRSYLFADVLRRTLEYNQFKVTQVINITDIGHLRSDADEGEDKMTAALRRDGKPLTMEALRHLADFYTEAFLKNLDELNIEKPTMLPKASENIDVNIDLIKKLEEKGFIYTTSDGVYFDTSKDKNYGRLGGVFPDTDVEKSRIHHNAEKRHPEDFALWKFSSELGWESPWGKGFPGWHIECSAMSMKYLGETFDIHTGGMDHIPIHHNNEIAQSESATGKPLANYWLHHGFIIIEGGKMAKSQGNFLRLQDITEKGVSPLAYRYWLLTSHYRSPVNFNYEALNGSQVALTRLAGQISYPSQLLGVAHPDRGQGMISLRHQQKFLSFINDDLDTPKALALVWDLLKDESISPADKRATILDFDRVLGLDLEKLAEPVHFKIPAEITKLADEREEARKEKDWEKADKLRKKILDAGFEIKDLGNDYQIEPGVAAPQ